MGTWGVSKEDLVTGLTDYLDAIEGDFDMKTLLEALNFMKLYCPTSDSTEQLEKIWRNKLDALQKGDE